LGSSHLLADGDTTSDPHMASTAMSPISPERSPASIPDVALRSYIRRKYQDEQEKLLHITGEPGDVERDEHAYGESSLTFKDVTFSVPQQGDKDKVILAPVSGHFGAGSLVALMGPSGCGKTTLLDILAAKKSSPHGGTVLVNGRARDKLFPRLTAYVPQDDVMFPHMTVKEVICFTERLKQERPANITHVVAGRCADELLSTLGLSECKDTWIGDEHVRGISGGQRRRVSVARGLASGAQIIFLDEPTSGLSATDAEACVRYMRLVAHKLGVTLIVVIHQPRREVARLFDHLLLMTANPGRAVYNGPMREAVEYWARAGYPVPQYANPTDYFLDLVTPDARGAREESFVRFYEEHGGPVVDAKVREELSRHGPTPMELLQMKRRNMRIFGKLPPVRNSVYGVSFHRQFLTLLHRKVRLSMRDKLGGLMALVGGLVKAIVVGVAYLDIGSKPATMQIGFIFMVLMTCALDGMVTLPQTIMERDIVKVEASEALYSEWIHVFVFSLICVAQGILANTIFVTVLFAISGIDWRIFSTLYAWSTGLYFTMDGLYGMIAAIAKDVPTAQALSLPFLILFLLYNGFTVSKKTAPDFLLWAIDISPVACSIESISWVAADIFEGQNGWADAIETFGYEDRTTRNLLFMLSICTIFRVVQVVSFKKFNGVKR